MKRAAPSISIIVTMALAAACGDGGATSLNGAVYSSDLPNSLYVASGACYAGGVATAAGPSNIVAKFSLSTGSFEGVVIDYNQASPGDSPVAVADYDQTRMLVLIENASGRRVDLVNRDGSGFATYLVNSTALSAAMRSISVAPDFSILVSKSTAIEKFNSARSRVVSGVNPYVSAPAGACATSTTLISSTAISPSGKIVYAHAAATPNNRIGVIKSTGYSTATDCLAGLAAPTTLALPTRVIFHPSGKLLVSYGSATAASNFVYSYDYVDAAGTIANPVAAFSDPTVVNGPSTLAVDPDSGDVFVANAASTFNTIERFHFASSALTRATGRTFLPSSIYTRCVSDMRVMQ